MPGTTSTTLPSFSHDQHHETDADKWKVGADPKIYAPPQMYYLVKFGSSATMDVCINRRELPKMGITGTPPLWVGTWLTP